MFFYNLPLLTCGELYAIVGKALKENNGHGLIEELNSIFQEKHSTINIDNPLRYLDMRSELLLSIKPAITSIIIDNILKQLWDSSTVESIIEKIHIGNLLLDLKYRYDYIDFLFGEENTGMIHDNADEHTFYNIIDRFIGGIINTFYHEEVKKAMLSFIEKVNSDDILLKNKILIASIFRNDYILVVLKRRLDEHGEVFFSQGAQY